MNNVYIHPVSWNEHSTRMKDLYSLHSKNQTYEEFCNMKDLEDRCEYWRCFYKSIFSLKKRPPTKEECEFNNVFKPDVDPKLLIPRDEDPIIPVTTAEDWADYDIFLYDIEKLGYDEDDYHSFLGDKPSSQKTMDDFIVKILS